LLSIFLNPFDTFDGDFWGRLQQKKNGEVYDLIHMIDSVSPPKACGDDSESLYHSIREECLPKITGVTIQETGLPVRD
jgi:hypothetical protein